MAIFRSHVILETINIALKVQSQEKYLEIWKNWTNAPKARLNGDIHTNQA